MEQIPFDKRSGKIWFNNKLVEWQDTKVHVISHGMHYASLVFEGLRIYNTKIFKLEEHTQRLFHSAKIMDMKIPYTIEEINSATVSLVKNQKMKDEMTKEFINYYGKNIFNQSTLIKGVKNFLIWCKKEKISMAVCTNKTDYLAVDLLKKIEIYDFFEYVAGYNTFDYCKPDPRHLTTVIEILDGDINRSIMIGDSESDANAAKSAGLPMILLEDGYTEKKITDIYHNHIIKDFVGIEKIVTKYL